MENFIAYNPTKLHFGKGVCDKLGVTVAQYGKTALLLYGKGSAVKYGYYDLVMKQLHAAGMRVVEYSGIKPNPIADDVTKAAQLARAEKADVIVALGGGSVIDSSKIIAICAAEGFDVWDVMKAKVKPTKALPIVAVLTLAATGTEMNAAGVIQNEKTGEKIGYGHPLCFPKNSFLDPSFTATVPWNYTAYGIVDLIAHSLEAFFGAGDSKLSDRFIASIILDAMHWAPKLMAEPANYEFRANVMLDATLALNGITMYGKSGGDWGVHSLEHTLSLLFDIAHGAGLSIMYPAWLKLQKKRIPNRISELGQLVFNTSDVDETISKFESFFTSVGSPITLNQTGIETDKHAAIVANWQLNKVSGAAHKLNNEDYFELITYCK